MRERLVVIGNGMAAGRLVEELLERAPDRYDIVIFGAEPRVNYNRIMLSPVLAGEKRFEDIVVHDEDWYARNGVTLRRGERVVAIDRTAREVTTDSGVRASYDELVIATGSEPVVIPVPGNDLPGVVTFRDLDDVEAMLAAAAIGSRAVVIGGGLLGLEAAAGLAANGMRTSLVHLMPTLMERQLDEQAGILLRQAVESRGIVVHTGANTRAIAGNTRVTGVELDDGRTLEADLVVMAAGIRPNTRLAGGAGIRVDRGVIVDDYLRTSDPHISAIGECVQHRGKCYGLVGPIYDMAASLATRLADGSGVPFRAGDQSTKLKVTGIDLYSAGEFAPAEGRQDIVVNDPARRTYRRVVLDGSRLAGVVLYGDTRDSGWYLDLLKRGTDVAALRETLIFGRSLGDARAEPAA
ncbi:MAG: NAD(P)/FAD-dependent oxidoreductase [Hyphomicrobiales bacterium]|nr:NAD(P)/FAD-dependent oxidoreductase [Hyphomicrobiales bacterium]